MTYYYYFVRGVKIERFITPMYGSWFVELTPEQKEFYLANPNATVQEVVNCQITPPYVPPTQDVQEYAAQKAKELKDACYGAITIDKVQCEMANCVLAGTTVTYSGKRHYTTLQAMAIMKQFMDESDKVSTIYETYKPQIEAANTIEDVDTIYEQAISQL